MKGKRIIVLTGATGVGKTDLSIEVAKALGTDIVSADSRQFYRELPIGTAMPSASQLAEVKHHFIADRSITEDYNSGAYEADALVLTAELFKERDSLLLIGGSGLYIDALCDGFDDLPQRNEELRKELEQTLSSDGIEVLQEQLKNLDPVSHSEIDIQNPRRLLRALEITLLAGRPYSELKGNRPKRDFDVTHVVLDRPREELYGRIDQRVDIMIEQGLEAEAQSVIAHRACNALQTVGYREMFDMFDGKTTKDEAIELIKRNSRRYAKRQLTWFRRDERYKWFNAEEKNAILDYIMGVVK